MSLVLSLFPGIGLLDMAFEEEGFCIVRGPDLLWGGDIKLFHPPAGTFDGVIGGPPCQAFSGFAPGLVLLLGGMTLTACSGAFGTSGTAAQIRELIKNLQRAQGRQPAFGNLIPEFERCVLEAEPTWFLMENVGDAPVPSVAGYIVKDRIVNNRWFGAVQNRRRRFSFGTSDGRELYPALAALEAIEWTAAVTAAHGGSRKTHSSKVTRGRITRYPLERACELQGLVRDFFRASPLRRTEALRAVANGVPLPMGRAIARAVKHALGQEVGG